MKSLSPANFKRLEEKVNLLNDKIDKLMEAHGVLFVKDPTLAQKEEEKMRKARERKQLDILKRQNFRKQMEQMLEDRRLQRTIGLSLQKQFNLVQPPSASRIREFQKTNNSKAFDGLKRVL